jgi:ATP:corrinoid adenosyltransferase
MNEIEELKCKVNNQPYSSTAIAQLVAVLTGEQSTPIIIPTASCVTHTNMVTHQINNQLELQRFFNQS